MAKVEMAWYQHTDSQMRQYCAEGTLDNHPKWRRVGKLELLAEQIARRIGEKLGIMSYQNQI